MARKSAAEKAESRSKILAATAELIRTRGIEGTSVSDIMDQVGMTHGGFYRHFESKAELIAEAISQAFRAGLDVFDDADAGTLEQAHQYIEQYLSVDHVIQPENGCPLPVLCAEVAREEGSCQVALADGLRSATTKLAEGRVVGSKTETLALMSLLVGTISLARAVGEGRLRHEILEASKQQILQMGENKMEDK